MQHRKLGTSDLRVSVVGLGCNNFGRNVDLETARRVIHKALDMGVTFFDTGDVYGRRGGSETIIGEVLGARRKDIVLATKFGRPMDAEGKLQGGSRAYIMSAVEASLKRLKTDWIDLYQSHKPDPLTPIEETLRALDDLVRAGKVRAIGSSHMLAADVQTRSRTARAHRLTGFSCCEDEYSLLVRGIERDLLPTMAAGGIEPPALLPARERRPHRQIPARCAATGGFALRGGEGARLHGSLLHRRELAKLDALQAFAAQRGLTILQVAMAWIAARPQVASVIAGATKPEQVEANVKAAQTELSADDIAELDRITG